MRGLRKRAGPRPVARGADAQGRLAHRSTTMNDYEAHDGLALGELVKRGEVSARDLLDAAERRMQQCNPTLNAVVTPLFDAAGAAVDAGLPPGPFEGVPFLVKELVASVAGVATTSASRLY